VPSPAKGGTSAALVTCVHAAALRPAGRDHARRADGRVITIVVIHAARWRTQRVNSPRRSSSWHWLWRRQRQAPPVPSPSPQSSCRPVPLPAHSLSLT